MKGSLKLAVAISWCGIAAACSGNVSRGQALYADGYFVEAAEIFERSEARLNEWTDEQRASYGLYRGMTLMRLGDFDGAQRWLAYSERVQGRTPGALVADERALLVQTQAQLLERRQLAPTGAAVAAQTGQVSPTAAPVLTASAAPLPVPAPGAPPAPPPEVRKSFSQ